MPRALCGVPRGTLENLRKSLYQLRDLAWSDPEPWSPYPELLTLSSGPLVHL